MIVNQGGDGRPDIEQAIRIYGPGVRAIIQREYPSLGGYWQDVLQEVFVEFLERLQVLERLQASYVFVIVLTECIKPVAERNARKLRKMRKHERQVITIDEEGNEKNRVETEPDPRRADAVDEPCPIGTAEATDVLQGRGPLSAVENDLLPIRLANPDDYSLEASRKTGKSRGAIRVMFHRMVRKLRIFLPTKKERCANA